MLQHTRLIGSALCRMHITFAPRITAIVGKHGAQTRALAIVFLPHHHHAIARDGEIRMRGGLATDLLQGINTSVTARTQAAIKNT